MSKSTSKKIMNKLQANVGRVIGDYNMIEDGDKILVAVSGGKDSLTMLSVLSELRKRAPVKFDLFALHIKTDFHCGSCVHKEQLTQLFEKLDVEYRFADIKVLDEKGKTTCFWCSWNKRKAFFTIADEVGAGKVALGHHKDDIAETVLMNLFYQGEISAMNPYQKLFEGRLSIIRPLAYVEEDDVVVYAKEKNFPSQLCQCPFGKKSKRKYVKDIIKSVQEDSPAVNIKTNITKSLSRIRTDYIDFREDTP